MGRARWSRRLMVPVGDRDLSAAAPSDGPSKHGNPRARWAVLLMTQPN